MFPKSDGGKTILWDPRPSSLDVIREVLKCKAENPHLSLQTHIFSYVHIFDVSERIRYVSLNGDRMMERIAQLWPLSQAYGIYQYLGHMCLLSVRRDSMNMCEFTSCVRDVFLAIDE